MGGGALTNRGGLYIQAKVIWAHVGRRFKRELLRGADGEILRLAQPRDDAADHKSAWRDVEEAPGQAAEGA